MQSLNQTDKNLIIKLYDEEVVVFEKKINIEEIDYYYSLEWGLEGETKFHETKTSQGVIVNRNYTRTELMEIAKKYHYISFMDDHIIESIYKRMMTLYDDSVVSDDGYVLKITKQEYDYLMNKNPDYWCFKDNVSKEESRYFVYLHVFVGFSNTEGFRYEIFPAN